MKKIIFITVIAVLFVSAAAAQERNVPFKDLPQDVKNIIATDLNQYAATIDTRLEKWLDNPHYTDDKHLLLKGKAGNYDYYLYCVTDSLTIEATYAGAGAFSIGERRTVYGTTVLFKCTTHQGAHSTSTINGEAALRKKYGCTDFTFKAL